MTPEQKAQIIRTLEASKGDDLYRAECAFRGQDLSKLYGESGQTKGEILDRYRAHVVQVDAQIAAVKAA